MPEPLNLREPELLRTLERLSLLSRRSFAGLSQGHRRSPRRGASVEFADYRDYSPGDDPRYVDWNLYGRLDRLFLRLFVEEEDLRVLILVDRSRSMAFGEPTKFDHARRVAAALAYIGLAGLDRVELAAFGGELEPGLSPLRGTGSASRLFDFLERLEADGGTDLNRALARAAHTHAKPGLAILISDFLAPSGYEDGLRALLSRRFDLVALQVVATEELKPTLVGDLKLVDSETGESREITVSDSLLRRYRERMSSFSAGLRSFCLSRGIGYYQTVSGEPLEPLVGTALRRLGFVR